TETDEDPTALLPQATTRAADHTAIRFAAVDKRPDGAIWNTGTHASAAR
ncbi:MAG: hypothetical protein RJA02_2328, partial [Armatimonadota bacterium]